MIRVAVVDDHPHVAIALRALLDETPDIQLVAESRRGVDVPALVRQARPHVLLLDLFIEPEFDALRPCASLRADFPELKICLLSAYPGTTPGARSVAGRRLWVYSQGRRLCLQDRHHRPRSGRWASLPQPAGLPGAGAGDARRW